jgi:hypothetical protein
MRYISELGSYICHYNAKDCNVGRTAFVCGIIWREALYCLGFVFLFNLSTFNPCALFNAADSKQGGAI